MTTGYAMFVNWRNASHLDSDGARRTFEAAGLVPILASGPVRAFALPNEPIALLPNGRGLVVGTLFERNGTARLDTPSLAAALPPLPAGALPRWFVDHLWGRYLAVFTDDRTEHLALLRDPTGLMPCYRVQRGAFNALAGDARLFHRLGLIPGRVDWQQLGLSLAHPDFRGTATPLVGVTEPIPGDVLQLAPEYEETQTLWSPRSFCGRDSHESHGDFESHAADIRTEVDRCLTAWTDGASRVLLSLSGGLDSSILAAGVPDASRRLVGVNLRSGPGRGDEREQARAVAAHLGFRLDEVSIDAARVDVRKSLAADLPRPSARAFTQPVDLAMTTIADRVGVQMLLNGGGGDSVFAFLHSANPAADRMLVDGLGIGFVRTLFDLAQITGCTIGHIGRRAWQKARSGPRPFSWPTTTSLLSPAFVETLAPPSHPWLDGLEDLLPGQREHAMAILRTTGFTGHLNIADRRPTLYPLLSQPLVERCLAVPSWLHCRDGRDRAVARAAFADRLPQSIIARRTKGAFDGMSAQIFRDQRSIIREMILDGGLLRNGILSEDAILPALDQSIIIGSDFRRLLHCVDLEAWASAWEGATPATGAFRSAGVVELSG